MFNPMPEPILHQRMTTSNSNNVDVLMATFNGSGFIESQILSLIGQTYKNWKLLIHDDGSTDETVRIIEKLIAFDDRISLLNDGIICGGPAKNFLHLLTKSEAPLIIFCDQDDIWFENKLAVLVEALEVETGPCAVYGNAYAYNGHVITADKVTLIHRHDLRDSLFLNSGVQGCSLMFNKALSNKLNKLPAYVYMHDHLLTIAAVTFGKLKHLDTQLMFYRQHNNNVTGNVPTSVTQRLRTFVTNSGGLIDPAHYEANKAFYETYKNKIKQEDRHLFEAYLSFPSQNYFMRMYMILKHAFKIGGNSYVLLLKTLIRKPI
jgi:glycosyltransferase involved in cell wall biosynthesis